MLIQKRKIALQSYYNKRFEEESRRIYDETRLALNQQLFDSISKSLEAADTEREVDDVDSKFNLHFPPGEVGADEGQYKRPKRSTRYSRCSKAGLWEVASKFGYSSEQLGLQLSLEKMVSSITSCCYVEQGNIILSFVDFRVMNWRIPRKHPRRWLQTSNVQCLILQKLFLQGLGTWYAFLKLLLVIFLNSIIFLFGASLSGHFVIFGKFVLTISGCR